MRSETSILAVSMYAISPLPQQTTEATLSTGTFATSTNMPVPHCVLSLNGSQNSETV